MNYSAEATMSASQKETQFFLHQKAREMEIFSQIAKKQETDTRTYENFIATLSALCERANNFLNRHGKPLNSIDMQKTGSCEKNRLYCFSGCIRFDKTEPTLTFPFIKNQHYKQIRLITFSVSEETEKCAISVKDVCLTKRRMKPFEKNYDANLSNTGFLRSNRNFPCPVRKLSQDAAVKILNWLLYKTELISLPFCNVQAEGTSVSKTGKFTLLE